MKWYKGDERIKPKKSDKRLRIDYDTAAELHSLEIISATLDDVAKYTMKAVNEYGSAKASVKVEVRKVSEGKKEVIKVDVVDGVDEQTQVEEKVKKTTKEEASVGITIKPVSSRDDQDAEGTFMITGKAPAAGDDVESSLSLKLERPVEEEEAKSFVKKAVKRDLKEQVAVETKTVSVEVDEKVVEDAKVSVSKIKAAVSEESSDEEEEEEEAESDEEAEKRTEAAVKKQDQEKPKKPESLNEAPEALSAKPVADTAVPEPQLQELAGSAPSFVIKPQPLAVVEGDTIRLHCRVKG